MKAVICKKYGPPDVLELMEIEKPVPKDDEVLIRVHATSLNAYDLRLLRADPFLIRLMGKGLLRPRNKILGADIAGRVETVGSNVKGLKAGDEVYGCLSRCGNGGLAEYVCANETVLALKPAGTTFEEAAAVPMAAVTALQGLRDIGGIQSGQKVLINGASGGVGTFAVQLAKSFGAEVTGVCSSRNIDMVRSIGADHIVDYSQEDFSRNGQHYDLILDVAANHSVADYMRVLNPNGICVAAGFSTLIHMLQVSFLKSWGSKNERKKIDSVTLNFNNRDLFFINKLLETRKIVPVIDKRYPLSEAGEAFRYFEKSHARGKVIITSVL